MTEFSAKWLSENWFKLGLLILGIASIISFWAYNSNKEIESKLRATDRQECYTEAQTSAVHDVQASSDYGSLTTFQKSLRINDLENDYFSFCLSERGQ